MKHKKWMGQILFLGVIGMSIAMLFFVVSSTTIGYQVKERCADAEQMYGGDCLGALMAWLEDEERSFSSRNSAIWALGQLGDARALPGLKDLYTDELSERENREAAISQYELKKAIKLVDGGINLTAWAWR